MKECENISYEQLKSNNQNLSFSYLEEQLKEAINLSTFNLDTLKTLELYDDKTGYNNAANILSNNNSFPGIDIAVFGDSINIIKKRLTLNNISILEAYNKAIDIYKDYYQYEEIKGLYRETIQTIPEEAFREALANGIIHRSWDINSHIRVAMYNDKIEIYSPGGLPKGCDKNDYLKGFVSIRRNPILSNIFYRLKIVELFGTGIARINNCYKDSIQKPIFNISENTIVITLPICSSTAAIGKDENIIYQAIKQNGKLSSGSLLEYVPFGKSKLKELLKKMVNSGVIKTCGNGRGTKYYI